MLNGTQKGNATMTGAMVVFVVEGKKLALRVNQVEKVLRAIEVTQLPEESTQLLGVIYIEGEVVPVGNIRRKLGLEHKELQLEDQIVIAAASGHKVAIIVDEVQGVLRYDDDQFVTFDDAIEAPSVQGVIKLQDDVIIVCDPAGLLNKDVIDSKMLLELSNEYDNGS